MMDYIYTGSYLRIDRQPLPPRRCPRGTSERHAGWFVLLETAGADARSPGPPVRLPFAWSDMCLLQVETKRKLFPFPRTPRVTRRNILAQTTFFFLLVSFVRQHRSPCRSPGRKGGRAGAKMGREGELCPGNETTAEDSRAPGWWARWRLRNGHRAG